MKPFKVEEINGNLCVSGASLPTPRAFFVWIDAQQFAEYLNAAW
jgi:hypothetical protein